MFYYLLGGELQASCGTLDEGGVDDSLDWEEEREMERLACEGNDFVPPKIMVRDQHFCTLFPLVRISFKLLPPKPIHPAQVEYLLHLLTVFLSSVF